MPRWPVKPAADAPNVNAEAAKHLAAVDAFVPSWSVRRPLMERTVHLDCGFMHRAILATRLRPLKPVPCVVADLAGEEQEEEYNVGE